MYKENEVKNILLSMQPSMIIKYLGETVQELDKNTRMNIARNIIHIGYLLHRIKEKDSKYNLRENTLVRLYANIYDYIYDTFHKEKHEKGALMYNIINYHDETNKYIRRTLLSYLSETNEYIYVGYTHKKSLYYLDTDLRHQYIELLKIAGYSLLKTEDIKEIRELYFMFDSFIRKHMKYQIKSLSFLL